MCVCMCVCMYVCVYMKCVCEGADISVGIPQSIGFKLISQYIS